MNYPPFLKDPQAAAAPFVCPFCSGEPRKRPRVAARTGKPRTLKLTVVPDRSPPNDAVLEGYLRAIQKHTLDKGYRIVALEPAMMTEAFVNECMACCASAIGDATFSDSYPLYCLREMQSPAHSFMQGSLVLTGDGKVAAFVLTNGMDEHGNLKQSLSQLKASVTRGTYPVNDFASRLFLIKDVSDFVHISLIVTGDAHREKRLATAMLLTELCRWARRGRSRAYVNVALRKTVVNGRLECSFSSASWNLYHNFGFQPAFRVAGPGGTFHWTQTEADSGKLMINLEFPDTIPSVAERQLHITPAHAASAKELFSTVTSSAHATTTTGSYRGRRQQRQPQPCPGNVQYEG